MNTHERTRPLSRPERPGTQAEHAHRRPATGGTARSGSAPLATPLSRRLRCVLAAEHGQTTAEYALVMLAAAALAGLLLAWAAGTDGIGRLLDTVLDSIITDAGS